MTYLDLDTVYRQAIMVARAVTTYAEADAVCKALERIQDAYDAYDDISDWWYYNIKNIALNAAYAAMTKATKK